MHKCHTGLSYFIAWLFFCSEQLAQPGRLCPNSSTEEAQIPPSQHFMGSYVPCSCLSWAASAPAPVSPEVGGSSSLLGTPQRQLSAADTERRRHQVLFIIKCREELSRRIVVSPRAVWPPTNSEGWVCFDTFPALRSSCNLSKQGETNVPLLSISLLLPYPPSCSL